MFTKGRQRNYRTSKLNISTRRPEYDLDVSWNWGSLKWSALVWRKYTIGTMNIGKQAQWTSRCASIWGNSHLTPIMQDVTQEVVQVILLNSNIGTVDSSEIHRNPTQPPGMVLKSVVNNGIIYQPQLVNAGFLNYQPYDSKHHKFQHYSSQTPFSRKAFCLGCISIQSLFPLFPTLLHALFWWFLLQIRIKHMFVPTSCNFPVVCL